MIRGIAGTTRNKLLAVLGIAMGAVVVGWALRSLPPVSNLLERLDWLAYDWLFKLRPIENRADQPVVLVVVDDKSIDAVDRELKWGWPWPRELWGIIANYLGDAGAKAIAFDITFRERSVFQRDNGDDDTFADLIGKVKSPVIFATTIRSGKLSPFAPPIAHPNFGIVNVSEGVLRTYSQYDQSAATLGRKTMELAFPQKSITNPDPFFLHYHGPHVGADGKMTYRIIPAAAVLAAARDPKNTAVTPADFRDKIVLIGAISAGTFDLKSSPLSDQYPGVEYQATAIDNLLAGDYVHFVPDPAQVGIAFLACLLSAGAIVLARSPAMKIAGAVIWPALMIGLCIVLFRASTIRFLPIAFPMTALIWTIIAGFVWSYRIEDRERRFMLKALARYISPRVADTLAADPSKLSLGGEQRVMTVLFTDAAGFTTLSETLAPDQVSRLMNFYLDHLSAVVLQADATLDKFIGDSIMCFWNAPVDQEDHARRSCQAAIDMQQKCDALQPEFRELGAKNGLTMRIGISTGTMVVGNMGSSHRFSYTVLGDFVNYGSRLEGANKFFGTRILLAEGTANFVKNDFPLRRIELLRVKGRNQAEFVYELLAEDGGNARKRAALYEKAWDQYRARNWDLSEKTILACLDQFGDDSVCRILLERVRQYRNAPPDANWDGSLTLSEK